LGDPRQTWYDVSLVDGYTLPAVIVPSQQGGSCVTTNCAISLNSCPTNEAGIGDLRVIRNGRTVQCLSPCKKWNSPAPFGSGLPESQAPGVNMCCPTPPISVEQCRAGPIVQTQFVKLVHSQCPSAYGYAYDDVNGLHNCPNNVDFTVTFCGGATAASLKTTKKLAVPKNNKPANNKPANNKPANNKPANKKPANTKPAAKPNKTTPKKVDPKKAAPKKADPKKKKN